MADEAGKKRFTIFLKSKGMCLEGPLENNNNNNKTALQFIKSYQI